MATAVCVLSLAVALSVESGYDCLLCLATAVCVLSLAIAFPVEYGYGCLCVESSCSSFC
jgi:hypothetical protein